MKGELELKIWLGYLKALGGQWVALVVLLYSSGQALRTLGDWVLADWTTSAATTASIAVIVITIATVSAGGSSDSACSAIGYCLCLALLRLRLRGGQRRRRIWYR